MTRDSATKVLALAVIGFVCLTLLLVLLRPEQPAGFLDLRIADRPQMTNGAMSITLVLSNGTSRRLNIVDDTAGKPFFVLDDGTGGPGKSTIGMGLSTMANMLKVNLDRGDTLTNAIMLTNPPPRFRLLVEARDLALERREAVPRLFWIIAVKTKLRRSTPYHSKAMLLPTTDWIDTATISTPIPANGSETNRTPAASDSSD
jgi:hypothetical protein